MVSTNSSQYATDFTSSPTAADTTKSSPLSLLAKTCEAIGLPDTPASKKTPKKDDLSPGDVKKSDSPIPKRKDGLRSPRGTPKSSAADQAAALAAMGLPKGAAGMFSPFGIPMGFPMGFPGMLPYPPMPYPSYGMPPFMRCPSLMLGRPCTNPTACPGCSAVSSASTDAAALQALAAASAFPGMPPFAYPFMPSTSTAASLPASYQQMLQAAAAASASTSMTPTTTTALPASIQTSSAVSSTVSTPSPASIKCQWSSCNKTFATADELDVHFKAAHNPSPAAATTSRKSPNSTSSSTVSSTNNGPAAATVSSHPVPSSQSSRYHPYSKPSSTPSMPPSTASMASFPFPGMSPFPALTAMYQRGLMGMPHP